jgi:hypothetical protein
MHPIPPATFACTRRSLLALVASAAAAAAVEPQAEEPALPVTALSTPLPLFDGHDLSSWFVSPDSVQPSFDQGELVVRIPKGAAFHAEVGGMDWDDYEVSGEFHVDFDPSQGGDGFLNLQFCPHDTLIFGQLLGGSATKIAYVEPGGRPFVESIQCRVANPVPLREWHRFSMLASGGVVATRVDGVAAAAAVVPIGTMGMFGILANFAWGVELRMRGLTVSFLKPTTRQLQQYARPAVTNWAEWVAARRAAGDTRSFDPKIPGKGLDVPEPAKSAKAADAGF